MTTAEKVKLCEMCKSAPRAQGSVYCAPCRAADYEKVNLLRLAKSYATEIEAEKVKHTPHEFRNLLLKAAWRLEANNCYGSDSAKALLVDIREMVGNADVYESGGNDETNMVPTTNEMVQQPSVQSHDTVSKSIEALQEYMGIRNRLGVLELNEGDCHCEDFVTCGHCQESEDLNQQSRRLVSWWGDSWAVLLWSYSDEAALTKAGLL